MAWRGLLLLVGAALARELQPPQIVRDQGTKEIVIKTGSINRFVLECVAVAVPAPVYSWYRDGLPLEEVAGVARQDTEDHTRLDFYSPQDGQVGSYHCEAANSVGTARSSDARVVLATTAAIPGTRPPKFTKSPKTEAQTLGSRVELQCKAEGVPEPRVVWLKNGVEVSSGAESLVIPALGKADVANYACNASNVAGYDYKNVIVNILTVAAKIKEGPPPLLVASKGRDVVLPCRAEGYPVPAIRWARDGRPVEEGEGDKFRVDSGFLRILKAGMADEGNYSCTAENHKGSDVAGGRLVVQDKTMIVRGPVDRTEPVQRAVLELECTVVADLSDGQELTVTWQKDFKDLGSDGFPRTDRLVEQPGNHSLFLYSLDFSDSGTYTCVGGTSITDLDTMSGLLTVAGTAPQLAMPEVASEWWEGDRVEVECRLEQGLTEKGAPTIYWYKDGERVGREGQQGVASIEDGGQRLVIKRASTQHSGEWVCSAGNSEGSDSRTLPLVVRRKTELVRQPQDLQFISGRRASFECVAVADTSLQRRLSVQWQHDGRPVVVECAFRCSDGATCLQAEQLCDGKTDCPKHETGQGGEDEAEEQCGGSGDGDYAEDGDEEQASWQDAHPCDLESGSRFVMADHSLVLCHPTKADLGTYSCHISSPLEDAIDSLPATLYLRTEFPWWILFLLFAVLVLTLCLCVFVVCWKRRRGRTSKGFYNPMDPENMKHNKSDIYYTTEPDADSIMHEVDTSCSDLADGAGTKTPIFTPKTLRHLSSSGAGSIGSLLEDDEFLKRGMNEDGSFRERYAE